MPKFDFSKKIPKIVPAHKLDEVEQSILNTFNNNTEDDNETDYAGSGDENDQNIISSFRDEDVLDDIEEDYNSDEVEKLNISYINENKKNKSKCLYEIDVEYGNIVDNLIDRACEQDKSLKDKKVLDILYKRYDDKNISKTDAVDRIDTINMAFNLGYDDIVMEMYMNFVDMMAGNFDIDCNHLNNFPKLNKIDENKNNKYYIKKKYNIDIDDINVKFISFRTNLIKYKKKSINYKNKLKKEQTFCVEFKNNITNILKDIKELEKEYDEILEMEKMDQLKKLYIRLSQNIEKKQNLNDNNNIYNLFNKLDNQKVDKLYILADIGKELKDQDIEDENKFLDTFKNKELYYIYDLKNKNKISRFINMCNKLCLLKEKINLASIIKNNLLTSIRDLSQNNFTLLLNMF